MDPVVTDADEILPPTDPLRSGTDMFTSRKQDVFACLGELEKKHSAFLNVATSNGSMEEAGLLKGDPDEEGEGEEKTGGPRHHKSRQGLSDTRDSDYRQRSSDRRESRNDDSGDRNLSTRCDTRSSKDHSRTDSDSRSPSRDFRRPQTRAPHRGRRQNVPDFRKHPDKYTHYSLGDVSERDMSDRSNASAAFAFLEERRLLREREERRVAGLPEEDEERFDAGSAACSQGVITFSRRQTGKPSDDMKHSKGGGSDAKINKDCVSDPSHPSLDCSLDTGGDTAVTDERDPTNSTNSDPLQGVTAQADESSDTSVNSFKSRKKGNNRRNIRRKNDEDSD